MCGVGENVVCRVVFVFLCCDEMIVFGNGMISVSKCMNSEFSIQERGNAGYVCLLAIAKTAHVKMVICGPSDEYPILIENKHF